MAHPQPQESKFYIRYRTKLQKKSVKNDQFLKKQDCPPPTNDSKYTPGDPSTCSILSYPYRQLDRRTDRQTDRQYSFIQTIK